MRAAVMSSLIGAMTMVAAVAQAEPTTRQEVKVPFAFTVNGQEMPAGTYSVREDEDQPHALLIQGSRNKSAIFVLTAPVDSVSTPQETSMVFAKDGDHYRLTQVWGEDGEGVSIVGTR
jgi:hypothetical protein